MTGAATTRLLAALVASACLGGCLAEADQAPPAKHSVVSAENAIRPTDGDGWQGNGYGADEVFSYDSASGHFRIWYTKQGTHMVPVLDVDPADGVPDYVAMVAAHADLTWASIIDTHGFRAPLSDAIYHDRPDYGGDARFDIYLQDIDMNDGYRVIEDCTNIPYQCAGYLVMENDFTGFSYASREIATKVLTSHEFGHGILDAYQADLPEFVTEGFATWFEEVVFPEQDDFEGFLTTFFRNPERPIDSHYGLADFYPYATAIWPQYIQERHGIHVVRAMLEAMINTTSVTPDFWAVTDEVLVGQGSSLEEAFITFASWNLFTDGRTGQFLAGGYANAADYPAVPLSRIPMGAPDADGVVAELTVSLERLSSNYFTIPSGARGGEELTIEAYGRARFVVMAEAGGQVSALYELRPAGAFARVTLVAPPAGQLYVVAVNPNPERVVYDGRLAIVTDIPEQPVEEMDSAESGEDVAPPTDVLADSDGGDMAESTGGGDDCACNATRTPAPAPTWPTLLFGLGLGAAVLGRRRS